MKNYRLFSAATLLIALFFAAPSLLSAQNNLPTVPYIEVRASATRKVTPDELYLKITIRERLQREEEPARCSANNG